MIRQIESKFTFFLKNVRIGVDYSFYMIYIYIVFDNCKYDMRFKK